MSETKRSLYQCFEAKVIDDRIKCAKGHSFFAFSQDGSIKIDRLIRGQPLVLGICQDCPDYLECGPPVLKEERGWAGI